MTRTFQVSKRAQHEMATRGVILGTGRDYRFQCEHEPGIRCGCKASLGCSTCRGIIQPYGWRARA